jgi:hypothetical protein
VTKTSEPFLVIEESLIKDEISRRFIKNTVMAIYKTYKTIGFAKNLFQ